MKIKFSISQRSHKSECGSAVLIILVLLSVMLLLVAANTLTVNWLRQEVKLVDKQQMKRFAPSSTNQLQTAKSVTNQSLSK